MKAIRVRETGGAEKLVIEEVPQPAPGPGEACVQVKATGVNFIDIYHRTGVYAMPLPFTPGMEAAGVVTAVGEGVTSVSVGDRVGYAMSIGSYSESALVPAWKLVKLPDGVDFEAGAAAMLQGMTAHYLVFSTFPLRSGETALIHAAAGGVGLLLTQLAKRLGAKVIGTVSTAAKEELARSAGADEVIRYDEVNFLDVVKRLTGGRGVDVVYDSVGKTTFAGSLDCLRPRGMLVLYGQSSGLVPPFDPGLLAGKGSLYLTRPILGHYATTQEEIAWRAGEILSWIKGGELRLRVERTWPLAEAAEAHRALESRRTTGKVLLIP
jgi:NADPH:quinone reductase